MGRKKAPPRWQEGRHEFDVVIPADKTKSGKEETVRLGFGWKVVAGRPMTPRNRTRQETRNARDVLARAIATLDDGREFTDESARGLENALTHAVQAWYWSHLRDIDKTIDDDAYRRAFEEKAPDDLRKARVAALRAIHRALETQGNSATKAVAATDAAMEILLEAVAHPPRNRRRFPAHLRRYPLWKEPRKPRVRPGSWIDTGRYRPAVVLAMMPDPPHIMRLSYGDEIDEDFRPHIVNWKTVRKRKRFPSLKDVFSPGDWIRHPYSGYGRLLAVRNSTMEVDFRGRVATVAPDAGLSRWEKVDDPGPEDRRPVGERLPPGTWIETDSFGQGVVLAIEDDTLAVLFRYGVKYIREPAPCSDGPVIWKLDRTALDLRSSWGRRWVWWWLHKDIYGVPVCACCGYPNFGQCVGNYLELEFEARECLICGYPEFESGFEDDDTPRVLHIGGCWRLRDFWDFPESDEDEPEAAPTEPPERERELTGYSLSEARRNYETRGVMFRPGDSGAGTWEKVGGLRRSLARQLDKRMAEPSRWNEEDDEAVEKARQKILAEVAGAQKVRFEVQPK